MITALTAGLVDSFTFDELVTYGLQYTPKIVNGMPWSFTLNTTTKIIPVTHESDNVYIVGACEFVRGNVLIIDRDGYVFTLPINTFNALYTRFLT